MKKMSLPDVEKYNLAYEKAMLTDKPYQELRKLSDQIENDYSIQCKESKKIVNGIAETIKELYR